jgi:hypothetical protein
MVPAAENKSEVFSFGTLRTATVETARSQAEAWLASTGRNSGPIQERFNSIWNAENRTVFEKVTDTLALDPGTAKLLGEINSGNVPKEVPAELKDAKKSAFYRANLAVAFARAASARRVYEEALDALKLVKPEQVIDPSAYFFHKAVAEHALMHKDAASQSIVRLLDDVADAPDRYKMVAALMLFDLQSWKADEKDLSNIAKLMDNSGRRLDLWRAGRKTQDIQKKIVFRLDEVIKELENQAKSGGS